MAETSIKVSKDGVVHVSHTFCFFFFLGGGGGGGGGEVHVSAKTIVFQ